MDAYGCVARTGSYGCIGMRDGCISEHMDVYGCMPTHMVTCDIYIPLYYLSFIADGLPIDRLLLAHYLPIACLVVAH